MHAYQKVVCLGLLAGLMIVGGCGKNVASFSDSSSVKKNDIEYYTCSMHPQVKSNKNVPCPICGMDLSPVQAKKERTNDEKQTKNEEKKVDYWTCSMHPQIKSDKEGSCPICGMDLTPVYTNKTSSSSENSNSDLENAVHLTEEGIRQAGVQVEQVQKRSLAKELLIFGTIGYDMNQHRDVVPLISGRVERQFIDFNQTEVKKGDPLVSIYSPEAIALQEEYLKALRDRWLSTFYERNLLGSVVALAEEKLKRIGFTEQDLTKLQQDKKVVPEIIVRSPINGSIVENMVHIGEIFKADQQLYHVAPLDEMWFNGQVFEPDLGLLKVGQTLQITTKSSPGEKFTGKLVFIGKSLDASNRTIPVRFVVPNPKHRLLPNLSANGALEIPLKETVSVANSAVLDLGTRHVVYLQKEKGVYLPRKVRVGHITQHYTQILEGLAEGDQVVVSGAFLIDAQYQLRRTGLDEEDGTTMQGQGREVTSESPAAAEHHH